MSSRQRKRERKGQPKDGQGSIMQGINAYIASPEFAAKKAARELYPDIETKIPPELDGVFAVERAFCNKSDCPQGRDDKDTRFQREILGLPPRVQLDYVLCKAREAALRMTSDEYARLSWDLRDIQEKAVKARETVQGGEPVLSQAEYNRMREIEVLKDEHPVACLDHIQVLLLDDRLSHIPLAPWLPAFVQDKLWSWHWWANYLGYKTVGKYLKKEKDYAPWLVAAIKASEPPPKGWLPETRRPGFYDDPRKAS